MDQEDESMCVKKKMRLTRGEMRLGFVYDRLMCRVGSLAVGAIQKMFGRDPFARHLGGGIPVSGLASGLMVVR
jgi:hypothetical protein